jgi:hypothetical protein
VDGHGRAGKMENEGRGMVVRDGTVFSMTRNGGASTNGLVPASKGWFMLSGYI